MTPVWQVDDWTLPASLAKVDQQWASVRKILDEPAYYDLSDERVSAWSCGEHAGHVAVANHEVAKGIAGNLQEPNRNAHERLGDRTAAILEAGEFPRGVATPPLERDPSGRSRDEYLQLLPTALRVWDTIRTQEGRLAACVGRRPHVRWGQMTSSEWVRFCTIYTAYHFAVVRSIIIMSFSVPHTNVCTISPPAGRPPQWEDAADVPVPVRSGAVVCRSADGRLRGPRSWWGGLLGGSLTRRKLLMRWRLHGDEPRKPADAASTFADVPRWSRTPR